MTASDENGMITVSSKTSVEDVKKLLREKEQRELEGIRAGARLASFREDVQRLDELTLLCDTALNELQDSYLNYDEDEPNVELAIDRARQLETMERDFDRLML